MKEGGAAWHAALVSLAGVDEVGAAGQDVVQGLAALLRLQVLAGEQTMVNIVTIIIMKNFNRRNSYGHHGSKRRELAPARLLFLSACWVFFVFPS